ncbi:hypothetical protein RirG_156900 [Rhizophagus irregularis DAOM 197198w]|uniref:Zinc finger bed domain-containing protein 1-like n=1 Tax=Rhizophagus irregularis (strain DAOM 197198w) TaxID=1432141 RepID=A0A015M7U4_RHIIW|nr:hypothetical protein RirG_156900 [Rhizophagus irregularis DAOM 197198w]
MDTLTSISPIEAIEPVNTPVNQQAQQSGKEKWLGGRPLGAVWQHFSRKSKVSPGKFEAECKYCSKTWKRGEVPILEEHLASHCSNVPRLVLREYIQKVGARENISNKKRKLDKSTTGQTTITAFHDSSDLPEARTNRINRALVKFFVCCGISYKIVEHLLFLDLLKELNAGYDPPTREYLSGCLLETELCVINDKIEEDIMNQQNLTLALDGWTSGRHQSIWNFVILTPSRKEYLYQLLDLLSNLHTAEFLAVKIEDVIEKIGPNRISAIVSDNAANVKKARAIISEKYPRIENVRCISHCINLIACDIVCHTFADRLLRKNRYR